MDVVKPTVRECEGPPCCGNDFFADGDKQLQGRSSWCLRRLEASDLDALRAWVLSTGGGPVRIGSMCSGTDSPVLGCQATARAICDVVEPGLTWSHEFSCEKVEQKRKVLKMMLPDMKRLFIDVCQMVW